LCIDRPDVLVLDEPTNHLDLESVEALAVACADFSGAIVFVSHDGSFCASVLNELWHCDGTRVTRLTCGFEGYKESVRKGFL
jgi:ATPase subunit of ABC transporter with duplicated ATPase domains